MQIVQRTNVLWRSHEWSYAEEAYIFSQEKEKDTKQSKINRVKKENKYIFFIEQGKTKTLWSLDHGLVLLKNLSAIAKISWRLKDQFNKLLTTTKKHAK